jgi:spore coat-associated protein N
MSLKRKLGLGMASAALGLSLVGGGTFAYFNDTASINNKFASGTLDLAVLPYSGTYPINFDLSNLKPGDSVIRHFKLDNIGTLAIKNVWMNMTADAANFSGQNGVTMEQFLDQFEVDIFRVRKGVNDTWETELRIFKDDANSKPTLKVLANATDLTPYLYANNTALLSPDKKNVDIAYGGLSVDPNEQQYIRVQIKFKETGTSQNEFQNTSAKFKFNLEATQYGGQSIEQNRSNGYLKQNEYKTQIQNPAITPHTTPETGVED